MRFDAVVFDLDGTLIDTAEAKHAAFFRLFPDQPAFRDIVAAVLRDDPDGSRHVVIPRMLEAMRASGLSLPATCTDTDRIGAYAQAVFGTQTAAPECPGAGSLLRTLCGHAAIYVSSNTPEVDLGALLARRGWDALVNGYFGHPRDKTDTVARIVGLHGGDPARVAVVGDGESDERSAKANGCAFFRVSPSRTLAVIGSMLDVAHV
jgi:phosphoglycolate phosphatase-like HAD superfamily hydrolase